MKNRRVVALVLMAALALAACAPGGLGAGDQGDAAASTTTAPPTDSTTPATTAPSTSEPSGELDAVVAEISDFVAAERGLPFLRPVTVELAEDDEFESRLLEDFDESVDDIEETDLTLTALGLIESDADLVEEYRKLLGLGVVGFYDPETDELVVRGAELTPFVRETIAHELTHALDDQHFELDRPEVDEADDETGFGFTALAEGNAVRVEDAYLDSLSEAEQQDAEEEELSAGADPAIFTIPFVLITVLVAPYTYGPILVEEILDQGGQARLDSAFAAPPVTSEQVLDPERFLAGEGPKAVSTPAADGEVGDQGAFGAFGLQTLFEEGVDGDLARDAVEGWGGDAYVSWRQGDDACIRLTVVGDTAGDTEEIHDALADWVGDDGEVIDATEAGVTVTSCRAAS
ncbi:MAG: hypothetical protein ACRD0U_19505 [Acidimicrobiales bacterium]